MKNLPISGYLGSDMAALKSVSGCVSYFVKMSRLAVYLVIILKHLIIHVVGTVQVPTSTWDLHDEYIRRWPGLLSLDRKAIESLLIEMRGQ